MGDESVLERLLNGDEEPKDLPLALLQRITNYFSHDRKIGQGGFAEVYKGVYNGEELAVKLYYVDPSALGNKQFENECVHLLRIRHPNIVRLLGYCDETQRKHVEYNGELRFAQSIYKIVCFEYPQGGSLREYLNESPDHDWSTCYNIIEGTCEGLNFLHEGYESQILHLDLKPENILLDKYMGAKLADFGLSRFFSKTDTHITDTHVIGTARYMPPEYRIKNQISPKNDVYSLGVTIIEIMAGPVGYSNISAMDDATPFVEQVITNWRKWINATTSLFPLAELDQVETCIKIAIKCVDRERKNRPTVAEILDTMQKTEKRFLEEWRNHAGFLVGQSLPTPTKSGPKGGSGGTARDIKEDPWRLHSLTISYQGLIDTFSFSYIDQSGKKQRVGPWGEEYSYHKTETIRFGPSEFVMEVSGAYGSHFENILVMSLTFVTNIRTYGPFGNSHHQNVAATPFRFMADEGSSIVAFHGRSGSHLFAIGVYMYPSNKTPAILKGQNESLETQLKIDAEAYRCHRQQTDDEASKAFKYIRRSDIADAIKKGEAFAKGGFGIVYKCELDGRDVAIKVPRDLNLPRETKAFKDEVEILGKIRHPYIVILHGACVEKCALVYEFLPNGTLEERLKEGKGKDSFPWEERIHVAANISTALVHLHDRSPHPVAHGDLKPNNILFDADNICKLGDFGISRFLQHNTTDGTPCHNTNEPMGTGPYMDPDFNSGYKKLTRLADQFAFGIILLELVTGQSASGLRKLVSEQMKTLDGKSKDEKIWFLSKLNLMDTAWKSSDKSKEVALEMLALGLRCSEEKRKDRPNFKEEVWTKIKSITCEEVPGTAASQQE